MDSPQLQIVQSVANRFSQLPEVQAVAVAGSVATGRANASSDVDVYIYPSTDISAAVRLSIGQEFSPSAQLVDYWGPAVVWFDPATNIEVEALFFNVTWMEDLVLKPLEGYQAQTGFTTCFWHTVKVSQVLFDRNGWFARLQVKANQPYPDALVQAIVDLNYPLLRDIYPSYRAHIASAVHRNDLIVITRTVWEFLASYFDILFAVNRMPHPGVKRMLDIVERECEKYPADMRPDVTRFITSASSAPDDLVGHIDRLVDGLEKLLQAEKLI